MGLSESQWAGLGRVATVVMYTVKMAAADEEGSSDLSSASTGNEFKDQKIISTPSAVSPKQTDTVSLLR